MITVADLIKQLETKDPNAEVEAIVATTEGQIVVMYVATQAKPIIKVLRLFN